MRTSSFYGGPRKPPKVCVNWWFSETTLHGFHGFSDVLLRGSNIVQISQSVDKRRYIYFSRKFSDSFYTPLLSFGLHTPLSGLRNVGVQFTCEDQFVTYHPQVLYDLFHILFETNFHIH